MAKILIDCGNIEDFEALEKLVDDVIMRAKSCNITYFKQAQARIEAGVASSKAEASRQIAEETGEKPENVRWKIRDGEKKLGVELQKNGRPTKLQQKREKTQPPPIGKFAFKVAQETYDLKTKITSIAQVINDIPANSLNPLITALLQLFEEALLIMPRTQIERLLENGKKITG